LYGIAEPLKQQGKIEEAAVPEAILKRVAGTADVEISSIF